MADISSTLAPKSDQQNYDDYVQGPRTVTVSGVNVPGGDQPVHVELAEYPGRPYKPNKSMRRILAKGWGPKSEAWVGKRLTLFGNPDVIYAGKAVGGIEVSAMSDIDKPFSVQLTVTRGKKKPHKVDVLPDAPAQSTEVPADILATIAKAKQDGNLPAYLEYVKDQNAPAHIVARVQGELDALKETGADA